MDFSDEAAFSLSGNVASNTFVKYKEDRTGKPEKFYFENLRDKHHVMVWFGFLEDGTKLDPIRISPGRMNAQRYLE